MAESNNSSGRDNFLEPVKRLLRERVAQVCSNPDCNVVTQGPAAKAEKSVNLGVAAHITAASANGPRYDADLTPAQRRSYDNGIWLCQNCGKKVDADDSAHSVALLRDWKAQAELRAKNKLGKPADALVVNTITNDKLLIYPEQTVELIGRGETMALLHEAIIKPQSGSHLLVNGMGGVGKTAICKTLAHRCASAVNAMVWLDGQAGVEQGLQNELTGRLDIDLQQADWLNALIDKLNQTQPPAVLFIDNIDDSDANRSTVSKLQKLHWHIVATSREQLSHFHHKYPIDVLPHELCIELFKRHYDMDVCDEDNPCLDELITLAGRHTLTVELLAKIASDGLLELPELLNQVQQTGFDLTSLTDTEATALHSGTELQQQQRQHQLHQHLTKLFQLANLSDDLQRLLRLIAVLPYQGYHGKQQLMTWLGLTSTTPLITLVKKGWLQRDLHNFAMHPVVAFMAKQQIAPDLPELADELTAFADRFFDWLQPSTTGHWIEQVGYQPQLEALIAEFNDDNKIKALLLDNLGLMLKAKGMFAEALPLYQQALDIMLAVHSEYNSKNSPEVATARNNLADAYYRIGQYEKALGYFKLALESGIKELKEDHPDVAAIRNNLGGVYDELGQYDKAIEYYQLALKSDLKTYGEDHLQVAIYRNNLALTYDSLEQYDTAIEYFLLALKSDLKTYGENHPEVARRRNNLAMTYVNLGQYSQAREQYRLACACFERFFEPDHHYVQMVKNNMAVLKELMAD